MASFNSYSSYNKKRKPTPKKKAQPKLKFGTGFAAPNLKKKAPPAPPSGAPVNGPPPAGIKGPAPPTLQGESNRIDAGADYNTNLATINQQIMQAALRYGGAGQVQQFGYNPAGGDTSSLIGVTSSPDDNSMLSTIARNAKLAATGIDQTQNAQNTFFSGNRLNALQTNEDDAVRQRAAAKAEYENAVADLINQLMGARNSRDSAIRNAGIGDIEYAASQEPEAAVAQPGPAAAAAPRPKKGYTHVQASGSRRGLSYKDVKGPNGKKWKKYENGELIPYG
jgi:hypothetical protein